MTISASQKPDDAHRFGADDGRPAIHAVQRLEKELYPVVFPFDTIQPGKIDDQRIAGEPCHPPDSSGTLFNLNDIEIYQICRFNADQFQVLIHCTEFEKCSPRSNLVVT